MGQKAAPAALPAVVGPEQRSAGTTRRPLAWWRATERPLVFDRSSHLTLIQEPTDEPSVSDLDLVDFTPGLAFVPFGFAIASCVNQIHIAGGRRVGRRENLFWVTQDGPEMVCRFAMAAKFDRVVLAGGRYPKSVILVAALADVQAATISAV